MTQEELDALMDGNIDEELAVLEEETQEQTTENSQEDDVEMEGNIGGVVSPPPVTQEHKVVSQLDDVTKDSEIKAVEIFDKLEEINDFLADAKEITGNLSKTIENNIDMFEKLCIKFPNVESFQTALEENKQALTQANEVVEKSQNSGDEIMMIMDIMQYQDIHRQKIERVINVMRALSMYMNSLFESNVDDEKRVSSAQHIEGDDNDDTVDEDDIEALLASFGKK